jgi:hypothetical protein
VAENGHEGSPFIPDGKPKESVDSSRDFSSNVSSHTQDSSAGSLSSGGTPKKHSLLNKIKGEAKVISGKLGKNEEKVEEGKRLLGK